MVQAVQAPCDPENMVAILSKDAGELKMINTSKFQPGDYNDIDNDDTSTMMMIFLMISVYNAVGLSAFDLFDDVDFDKWFSSQLLQELNIKHQK